MVVFHANISSTTNASIFLVGFTTHLTILTHWLFFLPQHTLIGPTHAMNVSPLEAPSALAVLSVSLICIPSAPIWLVQSLLMHTLMSLSSPMRFLVMIMFPLCVMCVVVEWTSGFGCTDVLIVGLIAIWTVKKKGLDQNQRLETQEMVGGQARANGGLDPIRKGANQMMEDQLETMRLQNQLNRTRMIANLMTWTWRWFVMDNFTYLCLKSAVYPLI